MTKSSKERRKAPRVVAKLAMQIAGVDDMDLYLCGFTSHDGTSALRVDASPIRVVRRARYAARTPASIVARPPAGGNGESARVTSVKPAAS